MFVRMVTTQSSQYLLICRYVDDLPLVFMLQLSYQPFGPYDSNIIDPLLDRFARQHHRQHGKISLISGRGAFG